MILNSCSQDSIKSESEEALDSQANSFKKMILSTENHPILDDSQADLLEKISKEVLLLSQNLNFNEMVFSQTLKQSEGDFEVELFSLTNNLKSTSEVYHDITKLSALSEEFEKLTNGVKLKLYFPRAASLEEQMKTNSDLNIKSKLNKPEVAIMNNYNEDYSAPTFKLDEDDNLVFSKDVTEDYANSHNVYIIGSEAMTTNNEPHVPIKYPGDPWAGGGGGGGGGGSNHIYRTEGRAEYGGKIQITDMNAIEHWTAGKLELRVVVVSSDGLILKDKAFDKRARRNFSNNKWYDFNDFYFNWNKENIGPFTVEKWFEMDSGGGSTEVTMTIPAAFEGGPTITVKVASDNNDEVMGQTIIQFEDRVGIQYGISHMNIKRK